MMLLEKTKRYAEKHPAFAGILAAIDATLDALQINEADRPAVAEMLLQRRFEPDIVLKTNDEKMKEFFSALKRFKVELEKQKAPITYRIFVYGTLKRGFRLNPHLKNQHFIKVVHTVPKYRMYKFARGGWFPLLTESKHGVSIEGELWEVSENCLHRLDAAEGDMYYRDFIPLADPDAEELCEAYLYKFEIDPTDKYYIDCGESWQEKGGE